MKSCFLVALLAVTFFHACFGPDHRAARVGTDVAEVARITRRDCGVSWSMTRGNEAGSGSYVTGAYPEAGEVLQGYPDSDQISDFIRSHSAVLKAANNVFGTWCVTPNGDCHAPGAVTCYLDISRETTTLEEAARLASACNQISVAHLTKDKVEILDSFAGRHFGDGKAIGGVALATCEKVRGR